MITEIIRIPRDGWMDWMEYLERELLVDALLPCDTVACRMDAVDRMIRKFPGTDGRRLLWAAVAGLPTENDRTALIRALRK